VEERGLREAAAARLSVALAVTGSVPLAVGLWAATAVGTVAGLAAGGVLAAALAAAGSRLALPGGVEAPPPEAPDEEAALVGSLEAVRRDEDVAQLLNLVSDRVGRHARRQLRALGRAGDDPRVGEAARAGRRLERLATSLRALAGEAPDPATAEAVPVAELVEVALRACDHAHRVDRSSLAPAAIRGEAAADLALVVAELVDNALQHALDDTVVAVIGRPHGDGYQLAVVDEGTDLSEAERESLNAALAAPASLAARPPTSLGLPAVARVAHRQGFEVRVLEWATNGLLVKVAVPAESVVAEPARARAGQSRSEASAGSKTAERSRARSEGALNRATSTASPPSSANPMSTGAPSASAS